MLTKPTMILGACVALALTGCARRIDIGVERTAILETDKAWASAAAAKDVERTVSFWADDAIVFPPDQPAVSGRDSIRKFVDESFHLPGFAIRWETTQVTVSPHGDFAYAVGRNEFTVNGPDGRPITTAGKGVTVWRKEADGAWKCVIDIWNNELPQGAQAD